MAHGDYAAAIEKWRAAIAVEDHMVYHEPPDWYYPMRESLGATFLRAGQAAEAEKVFREDLNQNPAKPAIAIRIVEGAGSRAKTGGCGLGATFI